MAREKKPPRPFGRTRRARPQRFELVDEHGRKLATIDYAAKGKEVTVTPEPGVEVLADKPLTTLAPVV